METITTVCNCTIEKGDWHLATCEHGRRFVQKTDCDTFQIIEVIEQPTIVCLCGSTRFHETFQRSNFEETMKGNIVLSVGFYPHSPEQAHDEEIGITPKQKEQLDLLHFRKIDLADEVLILNVGGYIGESTRRELAYAKARGKTIRFLEGEKEME